MINEKLRWASIQPLTGGMYLGAEEAIGHPAEFILSYKGLSNVKYDKSGENIVDAGNEYNLLEYLKKHNRCPKYYQLHKGMFDMDLENMNPEIYLDDELETPSYDNLDLVVAVPVCSGLSMVTTATDDTKNARNCNMLWISKYTLSVIKPKIYIFENAPTFMGVRGTELRTQFEEMAMELGYSILNPEKLKGITEKDLEFLKSGYRASYICDAIEKISGNEIDLDILKSVRIYRADTI